MFALFGAPIEIVATILCGWVDIRSVGQLDSALCERKCRSAFLNALGSEFFVCDAMLEDGIQQTTDVFLTWLVTRKVKTKDWVFSKVDVSRTVVKLVETLSGPHVRSLQLSRLTSDIADEIFETMGVVDLNNLRIVGLSWWEDWSGFNAFCERFHAQLTQLTFTCCTRLSGLELNQWNFPRLQRLSLLGVKEEVASDAESIPALLKAAPNLTALKVECTVLDNSALAVLSRNARQLQVLDFWGCANFTEAALTQLAEHCVNLTWLKLSYCPALSVEAFAEHCPVEGVVLQHIRPHESLLALVKHRGKELRSLSCISMEDVDTGLRLVAEHCSNLEELELRYCDDVTSDCLLQLVTSLPCLRELILERITVTDDVLIVIATYLTQLTTLSLQGSVGYTTVGAAALVASLHHLRRLGVDADSPLRQVPEAAEWLGPIPHLFCDSFALSASHIEQHFSN